MLYDVCQDPHQNDSCHSSAFLRGPLSRKGGRWLKEALCDATTTLALQFNSSFVAQPLDFTVNTGLVSVNVCFPSC